MQIVRDEKSSDDLIHQAVGALVQIGDPEASGAIIDATEDRGSEFLLPLLFALGQLGGLEAEAYLFTVQNGHQDPLMRQSASEALRELELRREEKKKVQSAP
jgi:HEAT repeat protein